MPDEPKIRLIPDGFGEVVLGLRLDNDPEPMLMTFGVEIQGDAVMTQAAFQTAAEAMATTLQSQTPSVCTWTEWKTIVGPNYPVDETLVFEGNLNLDGTLATVDLVPQNTAFLIRKNSVSSNRRARGRTYFAPVPENVVSNIGVVDPSKVTALTTSFNNLIAAIVASGQFANMVVLHTYPVPVGEVTRPPDVVVSMTAQTIVATQRRRLRR